MHSPAPNHSSSTSPGGPFPTFRRLVQWPRWRAVACVVLAVVVVAGVVDGVATVYYGRQVQAELTGLKATGKHLLCRDIAPPPVPAPDNAAPLYMAAAEMIEAHESGGDAPTDQPAEVPSEEVTYSRYNWNDSEDLLVLTRYVREDHRALHLLRDASARPVAVFDVDWSRGIEAPLAHCAKVRRLARFLAASAIVAAHEGNQAEALDRVRMGFVAARHTSGDPRLIGQLMVVAIDAVMRRAAEYVLAQGPIPEDRARQLCEELGRVDYAQRYIVAMQAERACGLDVFTRVRRGGLDVRALLGDAEASRCWARQLFLRAYPSLLRPVLYADELEYLRYLDEAEAYGSLTLEQRASAWASRGDELQLPHWAVLTPALAPAFPHADLLLESASAQRRLLQTALGLQVYRQNHGRYPDRLAELRSAGWVVPKDNFSERDLVYRRHGAGYILYSVGPNLKDDGGEPDRLQFPKGTRPQALPSVVTSGDVVWPEPGMPHPYGFAG
jgi:hypothetical protein